MNKPICVSVLAAFLSIFTAGSALASGSFYSYNLTVPKLSGNITTNNITKQNSNDRAVICSQAIGANYQLSASIELVNNSQVAGWQTISSNSRVEYALSNSNSGQQYHARIGTFLTTFVNVQAQGIWSPDNPGTCGI